VLNASTDDPLEGATVSAGGIQATTGADGLFTLDGVPVGPSVTIRSERAGFGTYTEVITVADGPNAHDIRMTRRDLYELPGVAVYVRPDIATVRGVILHIAGGDTRALATGVCTLPDPALCQSQLQMRARYFTLAATYGLAIMGSGFLADAVTSDAQILAVLDAVADSSDRPELALAPLLIFGASGGAPQSYGFTRRQPDRVIGFTVNHAVAPSNLRSTAAQRVPAYVLLAGQDEVMPNPPQTTFWATNRAEGAIWSYAIEPGATHYGHTPAAQNLIAQWMNTILGLRLPPTVTPGAPVVLNAIDDTSGWLGNVTTVTIAAYADYVGNPLEASWFPSQATAQTWQSFVAPAAVRQGSSAP
jgi:hypothetical protein